MNRSKWLSIAVTIAGLCVEARAFACGETADPANYFTFGNPSPAPESTSAPIDTAIVLRGRGFGIDGAPVESRLFSVGTVTLSDGTGRVVAVHRGKAGFMSDVAPVDTWIPDAPLAPNTLYSVAGRLGSQSVERPPQAEGEETIEFSFTTGSQSLPPLSASGRIAVVLTRRMVPVQECGPCGGDCREVGQRLALMATVTLPAVQGGQSADGYQGILLLTDRSPGTFQGAGEWNTEAAREVSLAQYFLMESGSGRTIEQEVPIEANPYSPCFTLNVWDRGGRNLVPTPICLDSVDANTLADDGGAGRTEAQAGATAADATSLGDDGGTGRADAQSATALEDTPAEPAAPLSSAGDESAVTIGSGCTLAPEPGSASSGGLVWVLAALGTWRIGRPRRACGCAND